MTSRVGVTGDIHVEGRPPEESVFRPGLIFLEGQFTLSQIKRWLLRLELIGDNFYKLRIPINNPYLGTDHGEFLIKYEDLKIKTESEYQVSINLPELRKSLKAALEFDNGMLLQDNTSFMKEIFDLGIQRIEDQHESNLSELDTQKDKNELS